MAMLLVVLAIILIIYYVNLKFVWF
jgi:hypothetical protein